MRGLPKYARVISLAFAFFACGSRVDAAEAVYSEIHERRQQEILGLTLDDAIALAVRDNRGIQTAYLQRVAQKFDLYEPLAKVALREGFFAAGGKGGGGGRPFLA